MGVPAVYKKDRVVMERDELKKIKESVSNHYN